MCGRFVIYGPSSRHRVHFDLQTEFIFEPRYNAAPSQLLPVIRPDATGRVAQLAIWGLVPSWARDPKLMAHPINAKSETAAEKPMFKQAFKHNRVIVPADAFYEWMPVDGRKQPYLVQKKDRSPLGLAGLLEHWPGPTGELVTFTILTTTPNALMAPIHNRMPAIIAPANYGAWLGESEADVGELQGMLGPYPAELMHAYPVGLRVNNARNEGPDLVEPAEL